MIPTTLHLTSRSVPLQGAERRLYRRNLNVLKGWDVRIWDDAANRELVRATAPATLRWFDALPRGVMRADVARCLYLYAYGGWYADTDYLWLRSPDEEFSGHRIVLPCNRDAVVGQRSLGNAVMASVAGETMWLDYVERMARQAVPKVCGEDDVLHMTGPGFLTRHIDVAQAHGATLADSMYFHASPPTDRTFGVHLTSGTWRESKWYWPLLRLRRQLRARSAVER